MRLNYFQSQSSATPSSTVSFQYMPNSTVRTGEGMLITQAIKDSLTTAAAQDVAAKTNEVIRLERELNTARQKKIEAQNALTWAQNLRVGTGFQVSQTTNAKQPRSLWYYASRSGKTDGHFIERFDNGSWVCSCPGWQNRFDCWASRLAQNNFNQNKLGNRWFDSAYKFDARTVPAYLVPWRA